MNEMILITLRIRVTNYLLISITY